MTNFTIAIATASGSRECILCGKVIEDRSIIVISEDCRVMDIVFHEDCAENLRSMLCDLREA